MARLERLLSEPALRPAEPGDGAALGALSARAWRAAYAGIVPRAHLERLDPAARGVAWRDYLAAMPAADRLWLGVEDGALAGFARTGLCADADVEPGTAELHGLYVALERIGAGLGGRLLRHAAADLADRGFACVVLWHFAANERAAGFYEHLGLLPDGARRRGEAGVEELRRRATLPLA